MHAWCEGIGKAFAGWYRLKRVSLTLKCTHLVSLRVVRRRCLEKEAQAHRQTACAIKLQCVMPPARKANIIIGIPHLKVLSKACLHTALISKKYCAESATKLAGRRQQKASGQHGGSPGVSIHTGLRNQAETAKAMTKDYFQCCAMEMIHGISSIFLI